jgi:uncharacterized protein (TIGR02145 family)
MACIYYNVTINQQDLNNSINNSDPELDGKVFISYTDCNGEPTSIGYSSAGTYPNAFCADPSESIIALYWNEDFGTITLSSYATEGGSCVAPTPTPTVTPSISISPTPSTTPLYECNCISFTNMTTGSLGAGYTACDGSQSIRITVRPQSSVVVCGSNPGGDTGVVIDFLGTCVGRNCIPFSPTPTPSLSITPTISVSPSVTPSNTPSISITPSNTPSISVTPSITPSNTVAPSMTPSPTISVSKTPSLTPLPSVSNTPSISVTPSITPSTGASPTPTPTISSSGSIPTVAGLCMTIEFGSAPSVTPSISPSRTPSATPTVTPSVTPTVTPTSTNPPPTPSRTPSKTPSRTPSISPSRTPSVTITPTPSPSLPCTTCSLADVVIGEQTWTACNLDVTTYRNGDPIPQVTDLSTWNSLTTGAWCYYDNNPVNGCTYNKLYNWYAVNDPRGLAPVGYHIPTEAEVETLRNYLGGVTVAGGKVKQTGTTLWNSPNTGATNETGWTGLPGGGRTNGQFGGRGISGPHWMADSSSAAPSMAYYMDLYSFNATLDIKIFDKVSGHYVRLIKDVPDPDTCNTILYKTQGNQYYSYNFSTNASTLLNVPAAPYDSVATSLGISISSLTHTSDKLWSYTWNVNGGSLNDNSIVEYDTTSNPFTATINRYIALPQISTFPNGGNFRPASGLLSISNTKLIGVVEAIGNVTLASPYLPGNPPDFQAANGMNIVEYDITSNVATWELKLKLYPFEEPTGGILLTSDNKLIILTKGMSSQVHYISQYNYNTGVLEYRAPLTPTITTNCGLAQVNGEIYLMGYNIYRFNPTTFALTLVQSPQTQLADSSQLISCINTNLPTSSCPECVGLPLKISTPVTYGGVTISPTYTGVIGDPTLASSPGARDNIYPGSYVGCYGTNAIAHPSYSLWVGNTNPATPYTYSLNFSEPVNNIKILYNGTNGDPGQSLYERFIWDTNGGTPSISLCKGCGQSITGSIISGSFGPELYPGVPQTPQYPQYAVGGGIITISAPLNYTTLTLRSPGGNQGSVFSICSGSVIPQPDNTLGCVYYSSIGNTYLYNVINNTSTPVTLPTDTFTNFAETHTSTRYWKGNQTDTIKEWIPTNTPNILALSRTINVSGITSAYGNYFTYLQAINDNTLLTTIAPTVDTCVLVLMDITDINVTAGDLTTLFTFTDTNIISMLLTSNNKIITIGGNGNSVYLTQYSYPTGTQEVRIDISSVGFTQGVTQVWLFESNGNLYFGKNNPFPTSIIYQINLNSPYNITPIYDNSGAFSRSYNSSINCNTVALNPPPPAPSLSPTPTPSLTPPVSPNVGVNTIYKYLDIL